MHVTFHHPAVFLCAMCSVGLLFARTPAPAQSASDGVQWSGRAYVSANFYSIDAEPQDNNVRARRPPSLMRLVFTPTLRYKELSAPFTLILTSRQTNVTTPQAPDQSLSDYFQNPANHISASPSYKWAQLHLGTQIPRFSELSMGDVQLFGLGVDLQPNPVRVAFAFGVSQRAVESLPDSTIFAYKRTMYAGKIGFGNPKTSHVDLNFVYAVDDTNSIILRPLPGARLLPEEGVVSSINFAVRPARIVYVKGEAAVSLFSRDIFAQPVDDDKLQSLDFLMPIRESTRLDYAGSFTTGLDFGWIGGEANVRYLGDGFKPLGFSYMQTDKIEYTLDPRVRLFENRLTLSGSVGFQTNNLSDTKAETSDQFIGSANVYAQITDAFGLSMSYSNFGIRNNVDNDTIRVEQVSQSFTIAPTYTITAQSATHTISLTVARDEFTDENIINGALNSNETLSTFAAYTIGLKTIPLSASLALNRLDTDTDMEVGTLLIQSASAGVNYRFAANTVVPSLKFTLMRSERGINDPDTQFLTRIGLNYKITRKLTLKLLGSVNLYDYGSGGLADKYTENYFQTTVTTQF